MSSDDKIVELFSEKRSDEQNSQKKFFHEFNYVRLNKDRNGNSFNAEHLSAYADKICYLVTIMREHDKNTWLYNYEVPSNKLAEFIIKCENNEIDGQIIDIDKYIPNDFA